MSFITQQISEKDGLTEVYRLRYKVYVEEWLFEKPENHPGGLETDEFDKSSIHFATRDDSKRIIGTVRLILDSAAGFPIERHCPVNSETNGIPRDKIAEISRLAISKSYRRRTEDRYIYGPDEERRNFDEFNSYTYHSGNMNRWRAEDLYKYNLPNKRKYIEEKRVRHEIVVDLYKAVYRESKKLGITHWHAIMAKGLYILLRKFGITFRPIGEQVDYHGIRTPYLGDIKEIEHEVSIKNPELFKEFTRGL